MDLVLGILLGMIVLTFLVAAHEFGHGIIARRNGVKVEEFAIGFPPKLKSKVVPNSVLGENVEYSINLLPIGGFVRLRGEHDSAEGKGTYGAANFWQKTKILLAGVAVNWIIAVALLTILAWTGLPKMSSVLPNQFTVPSDTQLENKPVQISAIAPGTPADKAGLQVGDTLVRFNGQKIGAASDFAHVVQQDAGKKVSIIYSRDNKEHTVTVTLRAANTDGEGYLGAALSQQQYIHATWSAPIVGVVTTAQLTVATVQGVGATIAKAAQGLVGQFSTSHQARTAANKDLSEAGQNVAGPIGIFGVIFPAAERAGLTQVVLLTALISLTLAVMNILPIPGLDGARWYLTGIFKALKRPLTEDLEAKINGIGMYIIFGLIVLVSIADIGKIRW